jgi:hypothetical protein
MQVFAAGFLNADGDAEKRFLKSSKKRFLNVS